MNIAQLNIAQVRFPLDDLRMAGFVEQLAEVNAGAEAADGFVWRLRDDDGPGATSYRILGRDDLIVNLSVWRDLAALRAYVIGFIPHRNALRDRAQWFERTTEPMTVCWPVAHGHLPTLEEAEARLLQMRAEGPSETAFPYSHRG